MVGKCPVILLALAWYCASLVAAPIPKSIKNQKIPQLAGTIWVSEDQADLGSVTYTFHEDGKLTYSYGKSGTSTYHDASWKQEGAKVYFECNKKYVEYNGTFEDGVMVMKAANVANNSWTVRIHPKEGK
jgi:hypothetical protein